MYSLENPAFPKKLSKFEEAQYGPRSTGVGAQILGADDKFICQFSEESQNFWGGMAICYNMYLFCLTFDITNHNDLLFCIFRRKEYPWAGQNLVDDRQSCGLRIFLFKSEVTTFIFF